MKNIIILLVLLTTTHVQGMISDDPGSGSQKKKESPSVPTEFILKGSAIPSRGPKVGLTKSQVDHIFKTSNDYVCLFEYGKNLVRVNSIWKEALGWEPQELLSRPYISFVHPDDVVKTLEYEKNGCVGRIVNRLRCKDGSYRWVDWIGVTMPLEAATGEIEKYPIQIARDITHEKRLEESIIERLKMNGGEKYDIKEKVLSSILSILRFHTEYLLNLATNEEDEKKGSTKLLYEIIKTIVDLTQSNIGFINNVNINFGIEKGFVVANSELWAQYESLSKSTQQERESMMCMFHKLAAHTVHKEMPHFLTDVHTTDRQNRLLSGFPMNQTYFGLPLIVNKRTVGVIGLMGDFSGREDQIRKLLAPVATVCGYLINEVYLRKFQREIEYHTRIREQEDFERRTKNKFLAHMSHELRTPLTGILGVLDLLEKLDLSEDGHKYASIIRDSSLHLLSLISDILDVTRFEEGKFNLEKVDFSYTEANDEVYQLGKVLAEKKGIKLTFHETTALPKRLLGDPTRYKQILFNLIGNSIKFTEKGEVNVFLEGNLESNGNYAVRGKVVDTGIGMTPEIQKQIFKPFSQGDETIARVYGGSGLGLYIAKTLCEQMGGTLQVTSREGKGSTFEFDLHFGLPGQQKVETEFAAATPYSLRNVRILVVEDQLVNQIIFRRILESAGAIVIPVEDGPQAVAQVLNQKEKIDLVLMDAQLPTMSGFTAIQQIREKIDQKTLPVIGITASIAEEDRKRFLEAGANAYLSKPIQSNRLIGEIQKYVGVIQ